MLVLRYGAQTKILISYYQITNQEGFFSRKAEAFYPPICLGEMSIHNDQVKHLLKISETAFVSGGHEANLILWRNGDIESDLRNMDALHSLQNSDIDYPVLESIPKENDKTSGTAYPPPQSESEN